MYQTITGENAYKTPMRIYPAVHYTMGGLWVDYNLMSNVPGLFVLGEANFSDHGANRLGASALMQGLADGYFVVPLHDCELSRGSQNATSAGDASRIQESRRRRGKPHEAFALDQRQTHRHFDSSRAWENHVGRCGMARTEGELKKPSNAFPRCVKNFGKM
jgi:succinate dehydrogenase / fumarate reductase flavoprotein subunit